MESFILWMLDQQNMLCQFPEWGLKEMLGSTSCFLKFRHYFVREPAHPYCGNAYIEKIQQIAPIFSHSGSNLGYGSSSSSWASAADTARVRGWLVLTDPSPHCRLVNADKWLLLFKPWSFGVVCYAARDHWWILVLEVICCYNKIQKMYGINFRSGWLLEAGREPRKSVCEP